MQAVFRTLCLCFFFVLLCRTLSVRVWAQQAPPRGQAVAPAEARAHDQLVGMQLPAVLIVQDPANYRALLAARQRLGWQEALAVLTEQDIHTNSERARRALATLQVQVPAGQPVPAFVQQLAQRHPGLGVYLSALDNPTRYPELKDKLYVTGLTYQFGLQPVANVEVLMQRWRGGHYGNFADEVRVPTAEDLPYFYPLLVLAQAHRARGEEQLARQYRLHAAALATRLNRPDLMPYLP
ncbi:MAG: hypothetical protein LW884_06490 [Bacteroidetes bacterium]|nr:hypothetical protein [Bacteroidota bacterium]